MHVCKAAMNYSIAVPTGFPSCHSDVPNSRHFVPILLCLFHLHSLQFRAFLSCKVVDAPVGLRDGVARVLLADCFTHTHKRTRDTAPVPLFTAMHLNYRSPLTADPSSEESHCSTKIHEDYLRV
jgi:hypothetical protein